MKVVIHRDWGAFAVPQVVLNRLGWDVPDMRQMQYIDRADPNLIWEVENNHTDCDTLLTITIPDRATDYYIEDYDGIETVLYVLDGALVRT